MRTSRTAALLACLSLTGACRQAERPESRPADAAVAVAPDAGGSPDAAPAGPERGAESSAPAIVPGPQGPFIEPPLESKPATIAHVLVGRSDDLQALQSLRDEIGRLACVPIGYPAVDQAAGLAREGGWTLVAGKFARRAFAEAEAEALEQAGYDAQVVERAYYHDRFKPALNAAGFPRAGRLFAGIPGGSVPVLSEPRQDAPGSSRVLADGDLVALR
ncbi:MAG: hypothetical protein JXR96_07015, partial [Deltaproteobacteria bacterium]|nr:hypothetical protein [Deltaproteobacteria bacterium]